MEDTDQVDRGHRASYGHVDDAERMSAEEMDEKRKQNIAYEYLCHLEEAKVWIQACINEELPATTELEDGLQNGVYLAKLGHFMAHDVVPLKKIYDKDQERWKTRGLHFRHTDNINHFFRGMEKVGLPKIFYPETTDIYDKKNMPKVIYCIHALSLYLFKLGLAPQIEDLYGKIKFTDEEISAMRKELEKYGIQMPAFSKIGGILANEMPVDEAALHAAVIAINEAVDRQDPSETLAALRNPAAHLINIVSEHADDYQDLMYVAKQIKAENAHNKSVDLESTWEPDVYDELLTQAEIQGNINKVNAHRALVLVNAALDSGNSNLLLEALQSSHLSLKEVKVDNADVYMGRLRNEREQKQKSHGDPSLYLDKEELQLGINKANLDADVGYQKKLAVDSVNTALKRDDVTDLMRALQSSSAHFPAVCDFAGALYLEEFQSILQEKGDDLDFDEIVGGITVLSAIARINEAVQAGHSEETYRSLQQEGAHIASLDDTSMDKYQNQLFQDMLSKAKLRNPLLTHLEIQEAIDAVNTRVTEEHERIEAIAKINEAIDNGDDQVTLATLQLPSAQLQNIHSNQAVHYQAILAHDKAKKAQISGDDSALLWLEEIQSAVDRSNKHADDAVKMAVNVADINLALDTNDAERLLTLLQNNDVFLHSVTADCAEEYYERLQQKKADKAGAGDTGSGWMMNRTKEGHKFYFNVQTMESGWTRGPSVVKDNELLTRDDIQSIVTEVTADYDRELLFKANEPFIIQVQALIRGHLARKKFQERLNFMKTQLPAIVAIQSCWRGYKQKKQYQDRLNVLKSNEAAVIKLQAAVRMMQARKRFKERKKFYKENEDKIVKIQACFRSNMARNDYVQLMHADDPPVSVVRKFVHLLDQSDIDYSEEIDDDEEDDEIQNLRKKVVTAIRSNQQLESDLDTMDIKIGLLVKNRITLHDVVSHDMKLKHYKDGSARVQQQRGLRALSKESRERVNSYQHLFYLLQTNPTYLAKLIFEMPHDRSTKFMESLVLTLYNYGSNTREEYLLLKLFKTALEEEVNSRVETMTDIVTGNPMVVKMVVGFNRNARGQSYLREMLNPLVKSVMDDRSLKINTNPIEVYKAWVNQTESETGQASGLPYDVTIEQALSHEEVRKRIDQSVQELRKTTDKFLQHILQSLDKIPYGMRYIAKVMKSALEAKFPEAVEKDILKIVGNLLYYRYINSAIVSPDAFDIIDISAEKKTLTNDQRRNLGSIAKILQFAASNKGFGGESQHLACLNSYIREAHDKFKNYFRLACDVEEPEARFNVDEFTDATMVTKPVIYISIQEIVDLHQLLYEHQDSIAIDEKDPLHELMEDLGDAPSIEELVGEVEVGDEQMQEQARAQMAKIEISLTLTNKFEVPDDDNSDLKSMLIRTKRMVVDVIRCQPGDNLTNILISTATDDQEKLHAKLNKTRDEIDGRAKSKKAQLVRQQSMVGDRQLPLESMKKNIRKNLGVLENAGIVSRKDNYQAIINMVVQDIRNQRRYRQRRKQELIRLRSALDSLDTKRTFYEEQIDYYNKYVKTCMDNLQQKGKKTHRRSWFNWKEASGTKVTSVKYNGEKLYERGVLLEIDGLPTNQFKNVLFEISATEDSGVFDVAVKYVGVPMDKVELVFQELLQLQYEGVAVMKMFQRAKINVNLLIFLLNKKFYGKRV